MSRLMGVSKGKDEEALVYPHLHVSMDSLAKADSRGSGSGNSSVAAVVMAVVAAVAAAVAVV